ncbi:hypothetical protein ONE56_14065 [Vibrio mytili]|uniref:hypothetical protein n=1 Tax=Vibrio mytili TaxID=50718 RepID=UPI003C6FECE0
MNKTFLILCAILFSISAHAIDKITWSTDFLDINIGQGQAQQIKLEVANGADVEGIKLYVVPELQRWVSITPSIIEDTL